MGLKFKKPNSAVLNKIHEISTVKFARSDFCLASSYAYYPLRGGMTICHLDEESFVVRTLNIKGEIDYALITMADNPLSYYLKILDHIEQSKIGGCIAYICTDDKELLSTTNRFNELILVHDRDSDEYLVSTEDHTKYNVKGLDSEKRAVKNFMMKYSADIKIYELDLLQHGSSSLLLSAYSSWSKRFKNVNNDLKNEQYRYLSQMLLHADVIDLKNFIICHNEQIIGFGLYEQIQKKRTAIFHSLKVDYAYDHVFDFGIHIAANRLLLKNYHTMNIEEDLGIEGIRKRKERMMPTGMITKWKYLLPD